MSTSSVGFLQAVPPPAVAVLVEQHLPMVARLVRERAAKIPAHVNRDELTSAAMMALFGCAKTYDEGRGIPFAYYAAIRIRGALLDELRRMDWAPRSVRAQAQQVEAVTRKLAVELDHSPRSSDIAVAMHIDPHQLDVLAEDLLRANLHQRTSGTANATIAETSAGPEALILLRERLGYLHDAIEELPERLRRVVVAHYFDRRTMCDIAAELGVTQPRVSQLCAEAVEQLRDGINSQLDPGEVRPHRQTNRAAVSQLAYFSAIATRSSLSGRLALSSSRGEMLADDYARDARPA